MRMRIEKAPVRILEYEDREDGGHTSVCKCQCSICYIAEDATCLRIRGFPYLIADASYGTSSICPQHQGNAVYLKDFVARHV